MKKLFILFLLLICTTFFAKADPIKIACVGNSITFGAFIENREKNCYPAQLQYYLGDNYVVKNFGVSSRTLLSSGDHPYIETQQYKKSLAFNPDIVFIKLGTNDTKPQNNDSLEENYKKDYAALIDSYQQLPSKPKVILLTPVRCYLPEEKFSTQSILKIIIPALEQLALEKKCGIINLYNLFEEQWKAALMPDKLHPSAIGAGMMAEKIGRYITYPTTTASVINKLPFPIEEKFNFHGYQGVKFNVADAQCMIVEPKKPAQGMPWVWRARFWGYQPQTDIALLENGFHIVYCDVANLYGAPKAVARWNQFYKEVAMRIGLNKKVVLEGVSRGGLIVYNWAVKNLDKIAGIYVGVPVLDIKSWPLGKDENHEGAVANTNRLLLAYGFSDTTQARAWKGNPIDNAAIFGKSKIPMLHIVGDADTIVPVSENTKPFEEVVKKVEGNIQVIHLPNGAHNNSASLACPTPIVNFILRAYGYKENMCTHAVAGNEFRFQPAGWNKGIEWHRVNQEIDSILLSKSVDVLLLGNSITQGFGGSRIVSSKPGKPFADKAFEGLVWECAGISGDRTQYLLWRLKNGKYNISTPKIVFITIGINNLVNGNDTPEELAEGIVAVAQQALHTFPKSQIVLLGLLPAGINNETPLRKQCNKTHQILATKKWDKRLKYVNPTSWFTENDGSLKAGLYGKDNLHLVANGYELWAEHLKIFLSNK